MSENIITGDILKRERRSIEAEFRMLEKMSDTERGEYIKALNLEDKRLEEQYVARYGQEPWDNFMAEIEKIEKEVLESEDDDE